MQSLKEKLYKEILKDVSKAERISGGVVREFTREDFSGKRPFIKYFEESGRYYLCYETCLDYEAFPTNPDYADQNEAHIGAKVRLKYHDASKRR